MGGQARMAAAVVSAVCALAPVTGPAAAQSGLEAEWREGLRLSSEDGRFVLKIGGRIQADWTFALDTDEALAARVGELEDASELRRARLSIDGVLDERYEFKIEYDFATGDAEAKDVYLGLLDTGAGNLRIGHFKEPIGFEVVTSSRFIPFIERSLVSLFIPERNMGILLHDSHGDRFNWGAGAFRESDGFSFAAGDDLWNFTGRAAWRPVWQDEGRRMIHVGLGATTKDTAGLGDAFRLRSRPEIHVGSRFVDTGTFRADRQDVIDLELAAVAGPFWAAAEIVDVEVETPDRGTLGLDGSYLQAGWFLTGEHRRFRTSSGAFDRIKPDRPFGRDAGPGAWEILGRWSTLDLSDAVAVGGELDSLTFGVNWYPHAMVRFMLNWVHPDLEGAGAADVLLVRAQVDF